MAVPSKAKYVSLIKHSFITAALGSALLAQAPVLAQDTEESEDPTPEGNKLVEEVKVTGIRRSLDFAADIKRESNTVVDAITAQDIGLFSDNNIGEALNRIPGVQLEREAGEGRRISIRGLGPRFVRTTINGRTALSSPGGEGADDARGFTFNIMPSEVVSKASVSKSTQANEIEGGIGGVVNLVTARPLEFKPGDEDMYLSGTLRANYNDLSEDTNTRGTVFFNNKFSEHFGLFFAASIDEADRIDNVIESQRLRTFDHDLEAGTIVNGEVLTEDRRNQNYSVFSGARYQDHPIPRDRDTFVTGLQWRSGNWDVNFDWTYGQEEELRDDKRYWMNLGDATRRFEDNLISITVDEGDAMPDIEEPTLGTIIAYEFAGSSGRRTDRFANGLYRRIPRDMEANIGGLNVKWDNEDWTVIGDVGFAHVETVRVLDRLRTRLDYNLERFDDGISGTYDIGTYNMPVAHLYDSFGNEISPFDLSHQYIEQIRKTHTEDEASDNSARLDFIKDTRDTNLFSFFDEILFGFAWNEMQFERFERQKQHADPESFDINEIGAVRSTGVVDDIGVPGVLHGFVVADIYDPAFEEFFTSPEGYEIMQNEIFDVTEENTALYVQGNFQGEGWVPFRGNIGVRYVDTDQTNVGWIGQGEGDNFIPADPDNPIQTNKRSYDYWLPSANIAFEFSEDKLLRFAANKALTRPDPVDLSARIDINDLEDEGDRRASGGNPNLQPYTTYSYDAIFEWYPNGGKSGFYAIGVFYKDLQSFIADGSTDELVEIVGPDGEPQVVEYEVSRPVNTDGGTIQGVELQFHTPLDFLPGFWSGFGVNGSYTYVDAEMDAVVPSRGTPISLRGTSEHSGNLVVYYERDRWGVRLATSYRDDYLHQEAEDPDRFDEFTDGRVISDLNIDFLINDNMKLRFTANNLQDEHRTRYWGTPGQYFSDFRDNGREYVLELRMTTD